MKKFQYHGVIMSLIFIMIFALTGCSGGNPVVPTDSEEFTDDVSGAGCTGSIIR